MPPPDQFDVFNDTDDPLPAGGLCQWAGGVTSAGAVKVVKPAADSAANLIVCGPHGIAPRAAGLGTFAPAVVVAFDPTGGTPAVGDTLGSQAGSFLAKKGNTGFVCYGGASGPWALCARDSRGGGGITVEEVDGAPAVPRTTTLRFDQADGFAVSEVEPGVARVDLVPPTGGCAGCGWVAGLTDLDCLLASVVERLGRCACDPCATTATTARYPTAATSTAGTGAFSEWNNTMGVFAAGEDEIAGCGLWPGELSGDLKATGFGFAIPTGATILGISVSVGRGDNMDPPRATDHTVRLLKTGTAVGTNKASGSTWPTALTEAAYGGAADLWGTTWTPAEINASDFGVVFAAQHAGASGESSPLLDWIRVTVTYEECETVNDGPVYLTTGDGEDWTVTGTGSSVTICGVEYALTFSREGCDGPCLTLTAEAGSGTAYTTTRDCCGPNYAIFSIGTPLVCTGTTDPNAGPVGNVARIKVEWTCCSADGYAGPGYYCVRDAGTDDACAPVEVLSAADVCAGVIEICSGPYSTLAGAEAACGEPEPVDAPCLGADWTGATYTLEVLHVGNPCPHPDESGTVSPLAPTYPALGTDGAIVPLPIWTGTEHYFSCAGGQYRLTVGGPMSGIVAPIYYDAGPPVVLQWFIQTGDGVLSCYGAILTVTQSAP